MSTKSFDAVAFDLDGTLYPNYRFYIRALSSIVKHQHLIRAFGRARTMLRNGEHEGTDNFYRRQAFLVAALLSNTQSRTPYSPEQIEEQINQVLYRGWEPFFKGIKLYPYVTETLSHLRTHGLRLGILSDMPPEQKIVNLKLNGLWDTVLCAEYTGHLKPHIKPFHVLINALGAEPERILYVGNSIRYDIIGARSAGIKTALISHLQRWNTIPDFIFHDYRALETYIIH
jgi:putative hydrolase of the HAD superfamily